MGDVVSLPSTFIDNEALVADLARYSEGSLPRVRRLVASLRLGRGRQNAAIHQQWSQNIAAVAVAGGLGAIGAARLGRRGGAVVAIAALPSVAAIAGRPPQPPVDFLLRRRVGVDSLKKQLGSFDV
jgi:hypothetical protein